MSLCTEGKNGETELLVASLLTLDDLCRVICYEKTPAAVKEVYLLLLVHCYVDTDVEMLRDQQVVHRIWQVLDTLLVDIRALANRSCSDQLELERLVAGPVCDLITLFFTRFTVDEQLSADFQVIFNILLNVFTIYFVDLVATNVIESVGFGTKSVASAGIE